MKWKKQQEASLAIAKQFLKQGQSSKELLKSISSKRKLIKVEKNIQKLEEKVATLGNQQDYTFDILLKSWMPFTFLWLPQGYDIHHLAWFIDPLFDPHFEQTFSLMKLISTWPRNRPLTKHLSHCMRICKSRDLRAYE